MLFLALSTVSCEHVPRPYWGEKWGDLPPAQNKQIQICIANVSTPWLMWIAKDASVAVLEDTLGDDFFKENAPDRLYILRRGGGNGRWMRWMKYDFSKMTRAEKSRLRLQHGDYIYFWSTKVRPVYSANPIELSPCTCSLLSPAPRCDCCSRRVSWPPSLSLGRSAAAGRSGLSPCLRGSVVIFSHH